MTREQLKALRNDPGHIKWGILYCCKEDPRVIVPRRPQWMGWTVNFAHLKAIPVTLLLVAVVAAPVWILTSMGAGTTSVWITGIAAIAVLCLLCAYLSSRTK